MGMWWRAAANVLRRGGVGASKVGSRIHTQTYTQPLLCQWLGDTMSPTAIVGPAWVAPGLLCVSQCVCVTPKGSLPGPPYATHPARDRRGAGATPGH